MKPSAERLPYFGEGGERFRVSLEVSLGFSSLYQYFSPLPPQLRLRKHATSLQEALGDDVGEGVGGEDGWGGAGEGCHQVVG